MFLLQNYLVILKLLKPKNFAIFQFFSLYSVQGALCVSRWKFLANPRIFEVLLTLIGSGGGKYDFQNFERK
jgi:hypothetical protein